MTREVSSSETPQGRPAFARRLVAPVTAAAVGMSLVAGVGAGVAGAATGSHQVVTRAGLAPALTAGRGAQLGMTEVEAETAATNGAVIGPDRTPYTLASEASGRSAVKLTGAGKYVEFTVPVATNAITVRYSIPDAPKGGGITAPINVLVNGKQTLTATLTSQYAWLYNQYPFSNDPTAGLLHPDWWITECSCVPAATTPAPVITKPFRPSHFYDEQRLLLPQTYAAGAKIRLQVPAGSKAAWYVIDLMDFQKVAPPAAQPAGSLSVLSYGADPTGAKDSGKAFAAAVAAGEKAQKVVYIPAGTFQVNRHIVVDKVTVMGAGSWYTIIKGHQVTLTTPLPDKSIHTGVGFYGKYAAQGGSTAVHLSGFAIEGDVRERVDTDQVNGIGGVLGGGSTIDGLYIQHTKVGMWFDGPFRDLTISNNVIVDQIADGLNLHTGISHVRVTNNFIRNTGDDGMAMWSEAHSDYGNRFDHNTVQTPVLANGIAIYGGHDNVVSDNLIADPIREGSALHAGSRFGATPFSGTLSFSRNSTVRAGGFELNWKIGLGSIWLYALDRSMTSRINVTNSSFLDSTYNAIMMVSDFPVKDKVSISNVHFTNIKVDGTGTSVLSARVAGSATFTNVDARHVGAVGINNCGSFHFSGPSEFTVINGGGNDGGWLTSADSPKVITCNDRPTVVPPPAPSAW
jgi:hypothetical protein